MTAAQVQQALQAVTSPQDAANAQRFFKTGAGEYGDGDVFIGTTMPHIRAVCKQFKDLSIVEIQKLLDHEVHEFRMAGLIIMANRYATSPAEQQQALYDVYLKNVYDGRVNNWDLVDATAEFVIGQHLKDRPRDILFTLARSDNIWQRRVAILSAFQFVKAGDATTTLELAAVLLHDKQDLIQKAVGWQLREVGKRCDRQLLVTFLDEHARTMPRTMLRYSLEHFDPELRARYMQAK